MKGPEDLQGRLFSLAPILSSLLDVTRLAAFENSSDDFTSPKDTLQNQTPLIPTHNAPPFQGILLHSSD